MEVIMLIAVIIIGVVNVIILLLLLTKNSDRNLIKFESAIREEVSKNREEMSKVLKDFSDSSLKQFLGLTQINELLSFQDYYKNNGGMPYCHFYKKRF